MNNYAKFDPSYQTNLNRGPPQPLTIDQRDPLPLPATEQIKQLPQLTLAEQSTLPISTKLEQQALEPNKHLRRDTTELAIAKLKHQLGRPSTQLVGWDPDEQLDEVCESEVSSSSEMGICLLDDTCTDERCTGKSQ